MARGFGHRGLARRPAFGASRAALGLPGALCSPVAAAESRDPRPAVLAGRIFLCRSRSAPSFVSPPPSIFCPAEGWLRGLREAACPGHRDGGRVRGALRAPSGSRAGGAASLPPARRPGLQRPNNGHIVLAAHRPSLASGGRPDPARGGSGRKPAAQIQIGRPWRRAGDRSAREPALTWGRRFSLPTAAGPPSLVPVALHPLLREGDSFDFT
ncbi:unnamed protein product [Rangifer tarandus platyrhynchus]|uniref:Uncharacterized protein n=1 Tax=Rangifer tarandus platyrhynchus TaxID=3082113 RepID=A0ABN8Y3F4_RANTA|nr:unnamed protein product [Rangifer tarandus platyrhynchus]